MLVLVHGGPSDQATVEWQPAVAYFVDRGWAVLRPDHRGSTGFGREYVQALRERWGELDVVDTASGIRAAAKRGWCDPDRVAIMGGSAGWAHDAARVRAPRVTGEGRHRARSA